MGFSIRQKRVTKIVLIKTNLSETLSDFSFWISNYFFFNFNFPFLTVYFQYHWNQAGLMTNTQKCSASFQGNCISNENQSFKFSYNGYWLIFVILFKVLLNFFCKGPLTKYVREKMRILETPSPLYEKLHEIYWTYAFVWPPLPSTYYMWMTTNFFTLEKT